MIGLGLSGGVDRPARVLLLGAHCDDIEIGCGGTVLHLISKGHHLECMWVVFSGSGERQQEARGSAARFLENAGRYKFMAAEFQDGLFPQQAIEIKRRFEQIREQFTPDVVFTHRLEDAHQDHRTIAEMTWQTFRDHMVCEYEIPKYECDLGAPNVFVPFSRQICERKGSLIHDAFVSQRGKHWFSTETIDALARLRGIQCRAADGVAEAFTCRKLIWK